MVNDERFDFFKQVKLCILYGLILGSMVGIVLSLYNGWYSNQFIQKGLSIIVYEVFSERLILSFIVITLGLLFFFPVLRLINNNLLKARISQLRISFMLSGLLWLIGGYYFNKSDWYPAIFSLKGIIGNLIFSFVCLLFAVIFYKIVTKIKLTIFQFNNVNPERFYFPKLFFVMLMAFILFNGVAIYKIMSNNPDGPNLVIMSIDTLRADHLRCYGYEHNTSPNIDKIAAEGVLFSQAYAQRGLTWTSLTSIMTSLYPKTHGVRSNQVPLDGQYITLAEILKDAGYKTGAFLANFFYAPNRGFDVKKGGEIGNLDFTVTRDAINWLDSINPQKDKFFLWLHQKNPHMPYEPSQKFINKFDSTYTGVFNGSWASVDSIFLDQIQLDKRDLDHLKALYDAEIRTSDHYLEELLGKLKSMGVEDNTLIVFCSDHGEELYDHNCYFYHGCSIYDGVLRIPLIFKLPKVLPTSKVVKNQVESIDILPTILDLLKVPLRDEFEGRSLLPFLFGNGIEEWHYSYGERNKAIYSIRTPQWKYIYNPEDLQLDCVSRRNNDGYPFKLEFEELYDVQVDPGEQNNILSQNPEIARELRGEIIKWLNTNKKEHKEIKLTKEAEKRLRALGYIK